MPPKGLMDCNFVPFATATTTSAMELQDDFHLDHHPLRYSCFFLVLVVRYHYRHYERRLSPLQMQVLPHYQTTLDIQYFSRSPLGFSCGYLVA